MNFTLEALLKAFFYAIPTQTKRTKWLIKHHYFAEIGENFFFQPRNLPADPKMIKFHNNVAVATNVTFLNHDAISFVMMHLNPTNNYEHMGCIEIMNNVFIGAHSVILPDVRIGNNVIVAAGSVVTKDVPDGSVIAGVPAKVIGNFDGLAAKRLRESIETHPHYGRFSEQRIKLEWQNFEQKRKTDID